MQYRVISPLNRDGINIKPGAIAELSGKDAESLLKSGTVEAIHKPFATGDLELKVSLK